VTVEQEASGIQVRAEGSSVTRQYEVVLPDGKAPREVTLSGQHLDKLDNAGYRLRKKGWWVNSDERTLHVLFVTDNFVVKVSGR